MYLFLISPMRATWLAYPIHLHLIILIIFGSVRGREINICSSNSQYAWFVESAVLAMRNKLKLSSDGGDFGSKKCKRGCGSAYGGVWRESGVRRSVLCWCVWQESGFSRREDVFT
jgi:hypothetical protein